MKNILFLSIVLMVACNPKKQDLQIDHYSVTDTTKVIIQEAARGYITSATKYYMFSIEADTMTITKADKIVAVAVSVPSGATDSTLVSGSTITIDGIATTPRKMSPGEYFSVGIDLDVRTDTLTIIARDKADIILVPVKQ